MLFKPLPYPRPSALVQIWMRTEREGQVQSTVPLSYPDFLDYRSRSRSFETMAAYSDSNFNLTGRGVPEQIAGGVVSASFFRALGVAPIAGRTFHEDEDKPGHDGVAVISRHLWQRRFGESPSAVGATLILNGRSYEVVGVVPSALPVYDLDPGNEVFLPVSAAGFSLDRRGAHWLGVVGRLRDGVSVETARAELSGIAAALSREFPDTNRSFSTNVLLASEQIVGEVRPALLLLLGAVGLVLLIAAANVANMLLARASARSREIAVRAALGANRGRLVRQLFTESLVLAFAGAAIGLLLRFRATLLGGFGLLALALAALGIYGVMAYAVAQRTREIGIRMALGAAAADVLRLVLRQALRLCLVAVGAGLAGAALLSRGLASLLYGVRPIDPVTFAGVALLLLAVAALAAGSRRGAPRARSHRRPEERVMGVLLQDLRYALRTLTKSPGFSAAAILILALGIGANAAIFSLVDAVVLKPLPGVARPKDLVDLTGATVSYPWYRSVRESTRAFDGLAAWRQRELAFVSAGVAERAVGAVVSGNYFEVLGVRPSQGRVIVPADEESGDAVAVIAERLWRTRLGSDPAVVGKTIRLNGASFVVVGVAPGGFRGTSFGLAPDLWVPIGSWPRLATGRFDSLGLQKRGWSWLSLLGRRRAEVSIAQAQSEIDAATRQQHSAFPDDAPDDMRLVLRPTVTDAAGFGESGNPVGFLALLAAAVAVALAIACANLGNLLLTRAAARRREIAVRQALGASRFRLLRQLLTESAVLAFLGGGAGLLVAGWALSLAERLPLPAGASIATFAPALDPRAFAFAFLLSAATALAFGLLPALHASRNAPVAALKNVDGGGPRPSSLRNALVVTQVSLCLALLVGAGLLGRSLQRALSTDLGFQPGGLVLASINPGLQRYDAARAETLLRELPRRLAASPGIRGASWMELVPLSGGQAVESFAVPGRPAPAGKPLEAEVNVLGGGFCRVMGIPLVSGREFDDAVDRPVSEPVIMVNEAMAKLYWPGRNAVGERLDIGGLRTIVGVTRDFRTGALGDAPVPQIYLPLVQRIPESGLGALTLVARADGPGAGAAAVISAEAHRIDPSLPVSGIRSFESELGSQLLAQRLGSALLGLFGVLSLGLAAVGIYAVVSYAVARRIREIGIRMALGARAADVTSLVFSQSARPIAVGLGLGLALGAAEARLLREFLFEVSPLDPVTFAAVALLLAACGAAAAWLPARRAARIDPMAALRSE